MWTNDIFRSEIGSGFREPGATLPPRIPRSTPLGFSVFPRHEARFSKVLVTFWARNQMFRRIKIWRIEAQVLAKKLPQGFVLASTQTLFYFSFRSFRNGSLQWGCILIRVTRTGSHFFWFWGSANSVRQGFKNGKIFTSLSLTNVLIHFLGMT